MSANSAVTFLRSPSSGAPSAMLAMRTEGVEDSLVPGESARDSVRPLFTRSCGSCGTENPPRAKFCLKCSKPIFASSLVQMHFFQQLDKPRLGTKWVEDPIDLESDQPLRANLIGVLQSFQCPPLVAETEVYYRGAER